jgi:putative phage-type endonuclease
MEYIYCQVCGVKNNLPDYIGNKEIICGKCRSRLYFGRNAQYVEKDLRQGTPSWHIWRKQGIGASEAPIAMGVSKWMTLNQLVDIKTGKATERPSTIYMERGKRLEEPARELYIKKIGLTVRPACLEAFGREWMRASLDGWSDKNQHVVEIKCPGEKDHTLALRGTVPKHYYPQLQHILAVTGFSEIDYWSYREDKGILLKVKRDEKYIQKLISIEEKIWQRITSAHHFKSDSNPKKSDPFYKEARKSPSSKKLINYSKTEITCPNPKCSSGLKASTGRDILNRVFICGHCGIEFELYESPWGIKPRIKSL